MSQKRGHCKVRGCEEQAETSVFVIDLPGFGDGFVAVCCEHRTEIKGAKSCKR